MGMVGCGGRDETAPMAQVRAALVPDLAPALESITADDLARHIRTLASDEFEGRQPGTNGEELTVQYLIDQFRRMGLKPGHPDGTYVQRVGLVGITTQPTMTVRVGGRRLTLKFPDEYVAVSRHVTPEVAVADSELVFVGYGVVAPEYGWDDYKGVDVRGKTLVMLINDPPVPDPTDPSRLDDRVFKGRAMTYYGRWTYKYETATEKGAAAVLIVHETEPAGYPYEVVSGSWGRENFDIRTPDGNMGRVPVEGWIRRDRADAIFRAAGFDFEELKRQALRRDFKPVSLKATATFRLKQTIRFVDSRNVVARLDGSDPARRDEYVIYTAHWDHLGRDPSLKGDQIYNGAKDNATGTAGLLEIAEAFTRLKPPPRRSVLWLAVTAEEYGLLGAKFYAANPLYPLERTVANINIDGLNQWGPTRDLVIIGYGNSTLDDVLTEVARARGRTVRADPEPEKGFFYRSDHFEFAKKGVPALFTDEGIEYVGKPEGYGLKKRAEYTARDYHKPSDEMKPDWDLSGAAEDVRLLFEVGVRLAQADSWPEWKPGTEFKAIRDASLRRAAR